MINYKINNFFDENECNEIIQFVNENGTPFLYNPNEVWDCKRIYDNDFNTQIVEKLKKNYNDGLFKLWFNLNEFDIKNFNISMTKYYEGRRLDLHLDTTSQFTTVIVLSNGFSDGRFLLSETKNIDDMTHKHHLKMGESISFDGSKVYHGVMPVTVGERYALNIWMTNTDYKYMPLKNTKSVI